MNAFNANVHGSGVPLTLTLAVALSLSRVLGSLSNTNPISFSSKNLCFIGIAEKYTRDSIEYQIRMKILVAILAFTVIAVIHVHYVSGQTRVKAVSLI